MAKRRLAPVLSAPERSRLGRAVLSHTLEVAEAVAQAAAVTGDPDVARWVKQAGYEVIPESAEYGEGLDGAARAGVAAAHRRESAWAVLHADLPLLREEDLEEVLGHLEGGAMVVAPSRDGGTSLVAGRGPSFPFAYGPGSFRRHLTAAARVGGEVRVVVRAALALDLDGPEDLAAVRRHPRGAWVRRLLEGGRSV